MQKKTYCLVKIFSKKILTKDTLFLIFLAVFLEKKLKTANTIEFFILGAVCVLDFDKLLLKYLFVELIDIYHTSFELKDELS